MQAEQSQTTFIKQADGSLLQSGSIATPTGRFQWLDGDKWRGTGLIESVADLIARMNRSGPYRYPAYRIVEAEKPLLVIKPTCAGCGMIAGIRCHFPLAHEFGSVPRSANADGQFSVPVIVLPMPDKKSKKSKGASTNHLWFNSIQCAENVIFSTYYAHEYGEHCGWCGTLFKNRTFGTKDKDPNPTSRHALRSCSRECNAKGSNLRLGNGVRLHAYLTAHGLAGIDGVAPSEIAQAMQPRVRARKEKRCALGKRCLRAESPSRGYRSQPALVVKTGKYCSPRCKGAALAIAKRKASFQTPINIGFNDGEKRALPQGMAGRPPF